MSKPILTYFDAPVSRGEECRLAFHLAGVDFVDNRVKSADWPAVKAKAPFGTVPFLEMPGQPPLGESNAILALIGRLHGLHPTEPFEAARHEAMMSHVEDLRANVGPTMRIKDDAEKKKIRTELASGYIPAWAASTERHLGEGPFFAGAKLQVVDLKLFLVTRWFMSGTVDHIPATIFDAFPKLLRLHGAVRDHAGVKAWQAKH